MNTKKINNNIVEFWFYGHQNQELKLDDISVKLIKESIKGGRELGVLFQMNNAREAYGLWRVIKDE